MKRLILCLSLGLSWSAQAFQWQDLWSTPDQRGRDLMAKNQYKEAKETFERSDWAAAAAYRAGDYQKAVELYQGQQDPQSYYNQGNALAHLQQYQEAIKAYDKALAMNPDDKDAIYNRKLVEELLKKNPQNKDQQNKDQQNKDQQNKEQQNKEQQNKDQQNKDQQNKEQQDKEQQDKEQQDKEQQDKEQQDKEQQDKEQQDKEQQDKEQQDKEQQDKEQQDKDKQDKDKQDKQDRQDKEQQSKAQQKNAQESEEEREKRQAKEQWLRLIPDDPGGLMREKFLRDHLRRQRGWYQ